MIRQLMMLALCAPVLLGAQTLQVKTGAWETTSKSPSLPRPLIVKDCVTKADVAQLAGGPDKDDDDECKLVAGPSVVGNKWTADKKCGDGRKVHAEFVAETPEKVVGTIVSTAPKGGSGIRIELSSRWLGASCAGIK